MGLFNMGFFDRKGNRIENRDFKGKKFFFLIKKQNWKQRF